MQLNADAVRRYINGRNIDAPVAAVEEVIVPDGFSLQRRPR